MEPAAAHPMFGGVVLLVVVLAALMVRYYFKRGRKCSLSTPYLRERAAAVSNALAGFANKRETEPAGGHECRQDGPDGHGDPYGPGLRSAYVRDYLPELKVLREEFAKRGVHEKALDKVYGKPGDVADVRTVSTALLVMAQRLR
jgi:hypothetical protein